MTQHITRNSRKAAGIKDPFTLISGISTPTIQTPPHLITPAIMSRDPSESVHIDPVDDDTMDSTSGPTTQDQEASTFVKAVSMIIGNDSGSKPKLREPDPLDGSNSRKLRTFILQCKLNFQDHPDMFKSDTAKVNYMLSFLKGCALDCFEPALLDPNEPIWLSDLTLFIEELETNFGTYDPIGEAEAELEALWMHDSHQAMKYFIKFQQLASHIQWGEAALRRQAYNGLAKRIKDDMVHHDKPNMLSGLRKLVQAIDARYWEQHGEVSHQTRASGSSRNKSKQKSDSNKSDNKFGKGSSHPKQKNTSSSSTQNKGSTTEWKPTTPDLSSKLGKDGKITPQERQRRIDNKLCLFVVLLDTSPK